MLTKSLKKDSFSISKFSNPSVPAPAHVVNESSACTNKSPPVYQMRLSIPLWPTSQHHSTRPFATVKPKVALRSIEPRSDLGEFCTGPAYRSKKWVVTSTMFCTVYRKVALHIRVFQLFFERFPKYTKSLSALYAEFSSSHPLFCIPHRRKGCRNPLCAIVSKPDLRYYVPHIFVAIGLSCAMCAMFGFRKRFTYLS